ncbi:MAG TPA: DUF6263 family protein [Planctomycetaceae bacterium]|nr:DUF6263 family protein [Planctomycetaceae bacterium]
MFPLSRRFAAACVLLAAASTASAQERLRWKFAEGEAGTYQFVQVRNTRANVMGQDVDQKMSLTMDLGWTVESVAPDGTVTLRQKISRVQMSASSPFFKFEYDSSKGAETDDPIVGQITKVFGATVGKDFTSKLTGRGEVRDVTLSEELEGALEGAAGGALPGGGFNADTLKQLVGQSSVTFPEEPVSAGANWSGMTDAKLPFGTIKIKNQFSYLGTEQRSGKTLHKIALKPELSIEADPNSDVQLAVKSQDASGVLYFDNRQGRLADSTVKHKMELDVMVGGQAFRQNIDQTTTMKLVPQK